MFYLWRFITSVSLCAASLLWLIVLTLLGTFSQAQIGLYDSQKKYFDSLFFHEQLGPVAIYLPGAYLVLTILFFNILCGGIIRLRKKPKNIGVFMAHCSILLLILAGWRSFHAKKEGYMAIPTGQETDVVQAYADWQLEIRGQGDSQVAIIPDRNFADCTGQTSRTFYQNGLPFVLKLSEYARNCEVTEEGDPQLPSSASRIDHFAILSQKVLPVNEENHAGLVLEILDASTQESLAKAVLGGTQRSPGLAERPPLIVTVKEKRYAIELTRERWRVPLKVKLEKFTVEKYEGTNDPKSFASDITKTDATGQEKVRISMNEPMRRAGYVFFQQSYGQLPSTPGTAPLPTDPFYTTLVVVSNPSDQWPAYACFLAGLGLLTHFLIKLADFLSRMARQRQLANPPPPL